jgi:hypothetical protein
MLGMGTLFAGFWLVKARKVPHDQPLAGETQSGRAQQQLHWA